MAQPLATADPVVRDEAARLIELGLNHEEQHQELLLMDIKHVLALNPLQPAYVAPRAHQAAAASPFGWIKEPGGLRQIGHDGEGFAFDNETPRHRTWLEPFRLGLRLVTCAEYLA